MSYRPDKVMSLTGYAEPSLVGQELNGQFIKALQQGMSGLCFSPYLEGQEPGQPITEAQIRQRMEIIKPYTLWIRSFSCTEGNELIPKIAKEYDIKTLVGAWISDNKEKNQEEIEGLLKLAQEGLVDIAAVGNEVLYRKELTEQELLDYIADVQSKIGNVPVGYVDAYYEFENRPAITEACDVILCNCYPFWEGCHSDYALLYMKDMYRRTQRAAKGKRVLITETGWPNQGQSFHGAHPSKESAMRYFINTQHWSKTEDVEIFYFSSFDESWKTGDEGDVGAYWGLWDKDEQLKF